MRRLLLLFALGAFACNRAPDERASAPDPVVLPEINAAQPARSHGSLPAGFLPAGPMAVAAAVPVPVPCRRCRAGLADWFHDVGRAGGAAVPRPGRARLVADGGGLENR